MYGVIVMQLSYSCPSLRISFFFLEFLNEIFALLLWTGCKRWWRRVICDKHGIYVIVQKKRVVVMMYYLTASSLDVHFYCVPPNKWNRLRLCIYTDICLLEVIVVAAAAAAFVVVVHLAIIVIFYCLLFLMCICCPVYGIPKWW